MITSVIRHRVADFLKQHEPFDALSPEDLLHLASSGKVKFHESDEYLFRQGDGRGKFLWVIQQGRVDLLDATPTGEQLRDVLGEGDMPGLEAFSGAPARYSARTASDVILYGVEAEAFAALVSRYPQVERFLAAHTGLSGNLGFHRTSWLEAALPPLEYWRARLVTVHEKTPAAELPRSLASKGAEVAAVVDADGCLVGSRSVAASWPASPMAVGPLTTRFAVREMLRSGRDHLVLANAQQRPEAMVTSSELALFCGHQPVRLAQLLRLAASRTEIMPLLRQSCRAVVEALGRPDDADDCCRMAARAMEALCETCIRLAGEDLRGQEMAPPGVPHCWVMFGAAARGDLLDARLPAIAVLYDDTAEAFQPEDSLYFVALAGQALSWLSACGLVDFGWDWPAGAQPSMPLSEWKRLYGETIRHPRGHDLYARREFFDVTPLTGDATLLAQLREHVVLELSDCEKALPLLASDTLAQMPPITFFRGLVLDMEGVTRESLDIGRAILAPVTNAARVFALAQRRLTPVNTLERLAAAAQDYPAGRGVLREAADAFRTALYYQSLAGGAQIHPGKLGKFDQMLLKTAFSAIQRFLDFAGSAFGPSG